MIMRTHTKASLILVLALLIDLMAIGFLMANKNLLALISLVVVVLLWVTAVIVEEV